MQDQELEYAGFWVRTGAFIIDSLLIMLITFPLFISIYGWEYFDKKTTTFVAGPADFMISWVLSPIVIIMFWIFRQATPGKMVVSARIVDAATGNSPTVAQCIGRYLAYFVSSLPLGLGLLWVVFDKRKQGWHDKLAGTVVVRQTRRVPPPVKLGQIHEKKLRKFGELNLPPSTSRSSVNMRYEEITPIQEVPSPVIATGQDLCALAEVGSGKMVACATPLIQKVDTTPNTIQAHKKTDTHISYNCENQQLDQEKEDSFYEIAWSEIQNNTTRKPLWAKLFSECDGDINKTQAKYISHRVNELRSAKIDRMQQAAEIHRIKQREEELNQIKETGLSEAELQELKWSAGNDAVAIPYTTQIEWICVCGTHNPLKRNKKIQNCSNCHRNRDFVLSRWKNLLDQLRPPSRESLEK